MAGKPRRAESMSHSVRELQKVAKDIYSLNRFRNTPHVIVRPQFGTVAAVADSIARLATQGDIMIGPIAMKSTIATINAADDSIDIGRGTTAYSSRVYVSTGGGSSTLKTIKNAQFDGQLLFLQGIQTKTVTLKNTSGAVGNPGNIELLNGQDVSLVDDDLMILQFDVADNKWQQVTLGRQTEAGGGASLNSRLVHLYHEAEAEQSFTEVSPAKHVLAKWKITGYDPALAVSLNNLWFMAFGSGEFKHGSSTNFSSFEIDQSDDDVNYSTVGGAFQMGPGSESQNNFVFDSDISTSAAGSGTLASAIYIRFYGTRITTVGTTLVRKLKVELQMLLQHGLSVQKYTVNITKTFKTDAILVNRIEKTFDVDAILV